MTFEKQIVKYVRHVTINIICRRMVSCR